jgi:hypothetical protein
MPSRNRWMKAFFWLVAIVMSSAVVIPGKAVGQSTSFQERFALSENRGALLAELIPGTEEYFFYHTLHAQNEMQIAEARAHLDAWTAKHGQTTGVQRMRTRQMLLEYSQNREATVDFLRREYQLQTFHPAPQRDEANVLASRIGPDDLPWEERISSTVKSAGGIGQIEDALLPHVLPYIQNMDDLRVWMGRIRRNDVPGLIDRMAEELQSAGSRGFGWASIHRELTLEQLQQLQSKLPSLLESGGFVHEWVRHTRVSEDESMSDPATRRKHLAALEAIGSKLPEVHINWVAAVLHQRLRLDLASGIMDRDRFLRYLQIPSRRQVCAKEFIERNQGRPQIDFATTFPPDTLLTAIGDDTAMIRAYLEHFFQSDTDTAAFSKFLDGDYLKLVFAQTKILYGIGDSKQYYSQLSPEMQREIAARVEVQFLPTNPTIYQPTDRVRLELELKNTSQLLVRIYRLHAKNILKHQSNPISTAIDLDGAVANIERRMEFSQRPDLRHRETIELPELEGNGVWVVECLASGQRSRALIHKGHLQSIQTLSDVGHLIKIVNAEGELVPSAKILMGEREFAPEADGVIVVPFEDTMRVKNIVLFDGNFAVLESFRHLPESYELRASFMIEPQSVLSGTRTALVVRPRLLCQGQPMRLSELESVQLRMTTTDLDGIVSTQVFNDIALGEQEEWVQPWMVPPRLAKVDWSLVGKIRSMRTRAYQELVVSQSTSVNATAATAWMHDLYLTRTDRGYRLEARGRNGEPCPRMPLQFEFKLVGLQGSHWHRLATDAEGVIELGRLAGIERFWTSGVTVPRREFPLYVEHSDWPERIHAAVGNPIELPLSTWDPSSLEQAVAIDGIQMAGPRLALQEVRGGMNYADRAGWIRSIRGGIRLEGLEAGNYVLTDHRTQRVVQVWVTAGEDRDGMIVGKLRTLWRSHFEPLRIADVSIQGDKLRIQIDGASELSRVHVVGAAFEHMAIENWAGRSYRVDAPSIDRTRIPSFYVDSLQLDEEYQYVLARQLKKPLPGSMLSHPSVLLNPWELSSTQTNTRDAKPGDAIQDMSAPAPDPAAMAAKRDASGQSDAAGSGSRDYEFLRRASAILPNLRPNAEGVVEIDLSEVEGLPSISVVAVHPTMVATRRIALPIEQPRALRERRLQQSLDPQRHVAQRDSIRWFAGSDPLVLGDAGMTKIRAYESIASLMPVMEALLGDATEFRRFAFLKTWPTLNEEQKQQHYGDHACHELHLFLYMHDRAFFDAVVKPYLTNKSPRQFMDDWLLDRPLSQYTEPWRWRQLNTVERVLLSKKWADQRLPTQRWLTDQINLTPILPADRSRRFTTALRSLARAGDFEDLFAVGVVDSLGRRQSSLGMSVNEAAPASLRFGAAEGGMGGAIAPPGSGGNGPVDSLEQVNAEYDAKANDSLSKMWAYDQPSEKQSNGFIKRSGVDAMNRDKNGAMEREVVLFRSRGVAREQAARRLYEGLEATRKWAESQFHHVGLADQNAALVLPSEFWNDYLKHEATSPFVSEGIHLAARSTNEALMALAVLGLPLDAKPATLLIEEEQWVLKDSVPCVVYVQGIVPVEASTDAATLLLSENFYPAAAEASARSLDRQALVAGVPYRDRVVMTNPTGNALRIQLLMQIPQGSMPLEGGRNVTVRELELAPFSTLETSHVFYFPAPGTFQHYGARATRDQQVIAFQESGAVQVLERPASVDDRSWEHVAAWGTPAQVLQSIDQSNLAKVDLSLIAWRMNDKGFWKEVVDKLASYGVFHEVLWGYALLHGDPVRAKEMLETHATLVGTVGPAFRSEIMHVDAEARLTYEHLDFRPLVIARSHLLGRERSILNDGMAEQYQRFLQLMAFRQRMLPRHRLSLAYYFIVDNRIEDAMAQFTQVTREEFQDTEDALLQYDSFDAYLALRRGSSQPGSLERAVAIARRHEAHPVPRWRLWFQEVLKQVSEREAIVNGQLVHPDGADTSSSDATRRLLTNQRELDMERSAALLPSLDIVQEGKEVWLESRNIDKLQLNYYLMDVELMFSRNPFLARADSQPAVTEPNQSEVLPIASSETLTRKSWSVPKELQNRNLILEVSGGGLIRSIPIYSNSLRVIVAAPVGRLQVLQTSKRTDVGGEQLRTDKEFPLESAYVKVYARHRDGTVRFYKDGYTDLRGQFDYVTLSAPELASVEKFALLVLDPEHGAWIRESDPPNAGGN